jgi:hypothetical protein
MVIIVEFFVSVLSSAVRAALQQLYWRETY